MPEPTKNQETPPEKEYIFTERVDSYVEFTDEAIQDEETLARLDAVEPTYLFRERGNGSSAGGKDQHDSKSAEQLPEKM